ncbi:MAG: endonuclease/exonuclease/phosphatase family protein [Candidatus Thorarchaeota archaeon]
MNNRKPLAVILLVCLIVSSTLMIALVFNYQAPLPTDDDDVPTQPTNSGPSLTLTNPDAGSIVSGIVAINISVIDEEDLVSDIFIDGTFMITANRYEWNTTSYPDGRHTIRAYVEDNATKSSMRSIEVTVDNVEETPEPFNGIFKVMVYNILESGRNDDWKTVVKQANPDILVLVETGFFDDNSNESLNAAVSEFNSYFADEIPYDCYCAQNVWFSTTGEAILSRFPILSFNQIGIVPLDDGSDYDVTHDFIEAVIDINGTEVHVFGGHLKASYGDFNEWRREREMEGMINYMDNLGQVPIIYLSDQNSYSPDDIGDLEPGSDMELGYGPMTMMLFPDDPVYGNFSSTEHTFTDVFRTLNPDDPGYSYGHQEAYPGIRIDYIIVNSFFTDMLVNSTTIDVAPAETGSDHYAVDAFIEWDVSSTPLTTYLKQDESNGMIKDNEGDSSQVRDFHLVPIHLSYQSIYKTSHQLEIRYYPQSLESKFVEELLCDAVRPWAP